MTREEAEAKIKAAAWVAASEIGWRDAVEMLKRAASEIETKQWERSR